jgi:hypothetical protein
MAKTFEATATLRNGKVDWNLCYVDPPNPQQCGNTKGTYPDVALPANSGNHQFTYKIIDQTGLGIKFANDPLWVKKGSQPTGPSTDSQIGTPTGWGTPVLNFVDKNTLPSATDPNPVVLKYQLNFTDQNNNPVTSIDPDITNGGTNAYSFAAYLLPVAIGLAAGILLTVLYRRFVLRRAL